MSEVLESLIKTTEYIKGKTDKKPKIGLILGSGLGDLADSIVNPDIISYKDIPGFPVSTVKGHKGLLVTGELCNKSVLCMQGRFHYYEGNPMNKIIYPIRVMKMLGIETLIITNAAGGINKSFRPGDLMLIEDHINLMGTNPLIGFNDEEIGPRFPDMSEAYDKNLRETAFNCAKKNEIDIKSGVYLALTGPSYETPAEIRAFRALGADAVGMSTVPEVIAANHCGIKVFGISCITNMAAGINNMPLSHKEVIATTEKSKESFGTLVKEIIKAI